MKLLLTLAGLLAISHIPAGYCEQDSAAPPCTPPFWEVSSDKGKAFLLAGVHIADETDYPMVKPIEDAFKKADRLLVELDLENAANREFQQRLRELSILPAGRTLRSFYTDDEYQDIQDLLHEVELPEPRVFHLHPGMVYMTCQQILLTRMGKNPSSGVDFYFTRKARKAGKKIIEAEKVETQLGLMMGEAGTICLLKTARSLENYETDVENLLAAWRTGKLTAIEACVSDPQKTSDRKTGRVRKLVFEKRNRVMARKIRKELSRGGVTFVVLGAGHFTGEQGIPALLSKHRKINVKRVEF